MKWRFVPIYAGLLVGAVAAFGQIRAQRAAMLRDWGWVCATDWPGMVILNVSLGAAVGWAISRALRSATAA